jgi:hypothetical protein
MTTETPQQLRLAAMKFSEEAYGKMRHHRLYATNEQGKVALAALARAMFLRRIEEGRSHMDATPTPWEEFFGIVQKLSDAGANVLQKRPGDPKPLPKPWLDPITNEPLPNPWKTKNLKGQTILQQRDPDLAAHFQAMAEDDCGTLAKMQDEAAARASLEAIPYGETEHSMNVFRGNDQTAQAQFIKNAGPGLVEFFKNEARDVEVPLFGRNRNLTIESRLAKDARTLALLKVAQQVRETWAREDTRAAQAQRDAANAEIERLKTIAA